MNPYIDQSIDSVFDSISVIPNLKITHFITRIDKELKTLLIKIVFICVCLSDPTNYIENFYV